MKYYHFILIGFGIYCFYAAYKGYSALIFHQFLFKNRKRNLNIDLFYNIASGILLLLIAVVLFIRESVVN